MNGRMFFPTMLFFACSVAGTALVKGNRTYVGEFGDIVSSYSGALSKDGIFEEVIIYPQETEGSRNRITRKGFLIRYPDAIGTVLIVHGFMCDKYDVGTLRKIFKPGMYNVMTFDLRAHGEESEGQKCTFGKNESLDVSCAVNFIKNHPHINSKNVYAYAFSMGTSAVIEAQAKDGSLFDAMVLDCPPDSSENVIKRGLENLKVSFLGYQFDFPGNSLLQQYAFHPYVQELVKTVLKAVAKLDSKNIAINLQPVSPVESIKNVTVPCFFIHCKNDEKVPVEAVVNVYNGAQGPKQLWLTKGRHHFDSYFYNPEKYVSYVRTFLAQTVGGQPYFVHGLIIDDEE